MWGAAERNQMKGDKPVSSQTSLKSLLQTPRLFVSALRAREGKEGTGKKEEVWTR